MGYIVTGPYITAHTGGRVVGFSAGAPLPPDVPAWNVQHLLRNNLIADSSKLDELVTARPGEPTGPHGRSPLVFDHLTEEEDGRFTSAYVTSGATTADPLYADRVKREGAEQASVPRPDPATLLDPREQLEARQAEVAALVASQEATAKAMQADQPPPPAATPPGKEGPPAQNEPKATWVEYATTQGADRSEAEGLSKEQLVGRFGAKK